MFLILAAAGAVALAPNSTLFTDVRPPAKFQKDATVSVQFADQTTINVTCQDRFGRPPAGMSTQACDIGQRLVMPNPCAFPAEDRYASLLCHELGHVNGWPPTHGDAPDTVAQGGAVKINDTQATGLAASPN